MQERFEIGSHVFIIISNRFVTEMVVTAIRGDFYTLKFLDGGAIQLRSSRIFSTQEAAEASLPMRKAMSQRTIRSPYDYEM